MPRHFLHKQASEEKLKKTQAEFDELAKSMDDL